MQRRHHVKTYKYYLSIIKFNLRRQIQLHSQISQQPLCQDTIRTLRSASSTIFSWFPTLILAILMVRRTYNFYTYKQLVSCFRVTLKCIGPKFFFIRLWRWDPMTSYSHPIDKNSTKNDETHFSSIPPELPLLVHFVTE